MPVQNLTDEQAVEALTQWAAISHKRKVTLTPRKNLGRAGVSWVVHLDDSRPVRAVGSTLGRAVTKALEALQSERES